MRIPLILLSLVCCLAACTTEATDEYTLYLVRHAEKQADGSRDPELTDAGARRSRGLADWFGDKNIQAVFSSDYKRTRDTAAPALSMLGLDLIIYDPRDLESLSERLLTDRKSAIVVGHSNTTPDLARLLCGCDVDDMDESEYDRLIVISYVAGKTQVTTIQQEYDPID